MNLGATAQSILGAFGEQLEAQGVTLPDRRYVAPGQGIPWDGEQFVVVLQYVQQGQPGRPMAQSFMPGSESFTAQFAVAIVRGVPALSGEGPLGPQIPSDQELGEAGAAAMDDAQALTEAGVAVHANSTVTGLGMGFVVGPVAPVGPDGGLAGHRLLIDLSL